MIRRVDFVLNPRAGRGRAAARAAEAARVLTDAGVSCVIHVPPSAEASAEVARLSARPEACVVACGGDGTVHWVAQGVVQGPAAFDILPAGTGNDIHSAIHGSEPDPAAALVQRILGGAVRTIDVGEARVGTTRRYFLGVCTTGFDSVVNVRANGMTRGPSAARYVAALARELPSLRPRTWVIEHGGRRWTETGVILAVANGGIYGGGMRISPRFDMSDGLLDITLVRPVGRVRLMALFPSVYTGRHIHRPEVSTWSTPGIALDGDPGPVMCDGEFLGMLPVAARVLPGALRVMAGAVA